MLNKSGKRDLNLLFLPLIISLAVFAPLRGQDVKVDTMKVKHEAGASQMKADSVNNGELILDEIFVEGRVSRPGVMIVPKRLSPKLKEKELERSFEEELKNRESGIYKPEKELHKVERVRSIKKALEKERKKQIP